MKARVLVVDDNADNRYVATVAMEHGGYRVEEAADGAEALERACARPPDVVLLDLMMPRLDGWETMRQLREMEWERPPVVLAVTARTDPGLQEKLRQNGFSGHISKPFTLDHLVRVVKHALESRSGWTELPRDPLAAP